MIYNLNDISFQGFGKIRKDGFSRAISDLQISRAAIITKILDDSDSEEFNNYLHGEETPVLLDIKDGTGLLCVFDPVFGINKTFLLDKTVLINPGIYFGVYPLCRKCEITYASYKNISHSMQTFVNDPLQQTIKPKINIDRIYTLFYQDKEVEFFFKGEKHNFLELTYVDKGTLKTVVDGKEYLLGQGEFIIYGENTFHEQKNVNESLLSFLTIAFDIEIDADRSLYNKKFKADEKMKNLLKSIIQESENRFDYWEDLVICYLKEFIIKIIISEKSRPLSIKCTSGIQYKAENSIVSQAGKYIEENIGGKINLQTIAAGIPVSPSYLSKIFKRHTGMNLVDYVNNMRLEKSKDLIKSGEYTLTQIASKLGYNSIHYFSNRFKSRYGINPSTYERSIKK